MSQNESGKTPTAIKIAAKEASQRNSGSGADPGPGDPSAAPSVAPQLVDIPPAPTASELVVKSVSQAPAGTSRGGHSLSSAVGAAKSSAITTLYEGRSGSRASGPKSIIMASLSGKKSGASIQGSQMGPAASNPSIAAAREPTSSRPLTGPSDALSKVGSVQRSRSPSGAGASVQKSSPNRSSTGGGLSTGSVSGAASSSPASSSRNKSSANKSSAAGAEASSTSKSSTSRASVAAGERSNSAVSSLKSTANKSAASPGEKPSSTASSAMQADSGAIHDEDEEGEGELEIPEGESSPVAASSSPKSSGSRSSQQVQKSLSAKSGGSNMDMSPASSAGGKGKMSTRTGGSVGKPASLVVSPSASQAEKSKSSPASADPSKSNKNVTKFRYHKRIVVRTSGKTSPSTIMSKVNKKNHQQSITPSTIDDIDPQELLKRAGIKNPTNQTHWRVRLRQTKRTTKNGQTTTQTKVAYRDSEGNKHVRTSSNPFCKNCNKKLEECKCDTNPQS